MTATTALDVAFKEWAVVCRAIATGIQPIILRKGGIAEQGGQFVPEYREFLLYPTYFHEQRSRIRPEYHPLFDQVEAARPAAGIVRFEQWVEVEQVDYLDHWEAVVALREQHILTEETVRQRFEYRRPGLYVLRVRAYPLPRAVEVPESPQYAGCKSWVQIDPPVPIF